MLTWEGVDLFRKTVTVLPAKNGERRTILINSLVLNVLKRKTKVRSIKSDYVFPSDTDTLLDDSHLRRAFRGARKLCRIENFHFHALRHTFATRLVPSGIDLHKVQCLLGHKSSIMTQRYAHHYMEKGALRVRVNNIHNLRADVEEIPTPGLGVGLWRLHRPGTSPLRWTIGGDPTSNSDQSWSSYAGWILYFAPEVVQAVIEFAARCSNNPDATQDYKGLCHLLRDRTRMRMI
ncbi:MAG: site-specific integrase [Vicinamibacterales bacterium]